MMTASSCAPRQGVIPNEATGLFFSLRAPGAAFAPWLFGELRVLNLVLRLSDFASLDFRSPMADGPSVPQGPRSPLHP
jgi:hypothetical protein